MAGCTTLADFEALPRVKVCRKAAPLPPDRNSRNDNFGYKFRCSYRQREVVVKDPGTLFHASNMRLKLFDRNDNERSLLKTPTATWLGYRVFPRNSPGS